MRPIKITSKRDFKKVLAQMLEQRLDETQNHFYHAMNFKLKSFKDCKVVKVNSWCYPSGKIIYLAYNMFYDETENSNRFSDARI